MKNIFLFLVLIFFLTVASLAFATTSTINPSIPAQNSALSSATLRGQFLAAYNDINSLWNSALNVFSPSSNGLAPATNGADATHFLSANGGWLVPAGGGGGGGTPGGQNTNVQVNALGVFGGDSGFTYLSGAATLGSSLQVPTISGGNGSASNLILQASSGPGVNGSILFNTGQQIQGMAIGTNGVSVGTATGGAQGFGTINATGVYVNGVAVGGSGIQPVAGGGTGAGNVAQAQLNLSILSSVNVQNSPYNASGFIVQTTTGGSIATQTTNIPVVSSAGFNVGQIVVIATAGTSGLSNFAQMIAAIPDSTHITLSTNALSGSFSLPPASTTATNGTQGTLFTGGILVYSFGTTTLSALAANGATSLSFTNAASYKVGQGLFVASGGVSGANLITTITSVSGNTVTISPGISNASGVAASTIVMHDDTAAFQAAFNIASYTQNVNVYVPDGFYQINGATQLSGTANATVLVPSLTYWNTSQTYWYPMATIHMYGSTWAPQDQYYQTGRVAINVSGAVIQTIKSDGSAIFGGYGGASSTGASLNNFTNVQLQVSNVTIRTYPNPNSSGIDAAHIASFQIDHSTLDTGQAGTTVQPTHTAIFAARGPVEENGGEILFNSLEIQGWYYGTITSEHTRFEHIRYDNDFIPQLLNQGGTTSAYGTTSVDVNFDASPHGVQANGPIKINYEWLNIEHNVSGPGWQNSVADFEDASGYLTGFVSYDQITFGGPSPNVTNTPNLHIVNGKGPAYPLPDQVFSDLSNSHYTSSPNGMMVYCSDCTIASPCAGSGTGALAKRLNGAWVCN